MTSRSPGGSRPAKPYAGAATTATRPDDTDALELAVQLAGTALAHTPRSARSWIYQLDESGYTSVMTKRLVEIDDEVLAAARKALGADTIRATVHAALQEAASLALRRKFLERAAADGLPDLRDPEVLAGSWR
jgi:Arc/MetJ family transcription regulator